MMNSLVLSILSGIGGLAVGVVIMMITSRLGLNRDQQKAKLLLEEAQIKSENLVRQAVLDGRTQAYELKLAAEKEVKERKQELQDKENKLTRREDNLNFRDETLTAKEKQIENKNSQITDKLNVLEKMETQLQAKIDNQIVELERIASMSADDAKKELMDAVEKKMDKEVSVYIREREDEARSKAADSARNIIALAIQRYAQEETIERTVSVVKATIPENSALFRHIVNRVKECLML